MTALSCEIGVRQAGTRQVWVTEPAMLVDTVGGVKCAQTALHFLLGSFGTKLTGNIHHARVTFRLVDEDRIV